MRIDISPWGVVTDQRELAPGMISVKTKRHGGIWVSPERLEKMPIKKTAYSRGGWFEEDCDWALVAVTFPEAFDERSRLRAADICRRRFPELQETTGQPPSLAPTSTDT